MWRRKKRIKSEIHPDEILIDSKNIGEFDTDRFEGRIERPLGRRSFLSIASLLLVLVLVLVGRAGELQIVQGATYAKQAEENQLEQKVIIADRGTIVDRNGVTLAFNDRASTTDEFAAREYSTLRGVSHVVGYVKPPAKDSSGTYYRDVFEGMDGVEEAYNTELAGTNGEKLTETNARGQVVSESTEQEPVQGSQVRLSIDAEVTQAFTTASRK